MKVELRAIEYYLPEHVEDAQALQSAQPDWPVLDILKKTGVQQRHLAQAEDTTESLGFRAASKLLEKIADRTDIGFIIVVTQSPDQALPGVACLLQESLGLSGRCAAFDVNLGCSGFVYALAIGGSLIESGLARSGLIICSERYSQYIDSDDRTCRPLFSDGAAAALLARSTIDNLGPFDLGTDGRGARDIMVSDGKLKMDGAQVLMFTMQAVPQTVLHTLQDANLDLDEIDLFVFHQASRIVIDNLIRHLALPPEKVFTNYDVVGNTVSASIPIALKHAAEVGRLKPGARVMLVGFGVGYSWGTCVMRWSAAVSENKTCRFRNAKSKFEPGRTAVQLTENQILDILTDALSPRATRLTMETRSQDIAEWDSMGHLAVLVSLDSALNGRAASVNQLVTSRSVREIVQVLRQHSLCS